MSSLVIAALPFTVSCLERVFQNLVEGTDRDVVITLTDSYPWSDDRIQSWPWRYEESVLSRFYEKLRDRGIYVSVEAPDPGTHPFLLRGAHLAYLAHAFGSNGAGVDDLREAMTRDLNELWPGAPLRLIDNVTLFRSLDVLPGSGPAALTSAEVSRRESGAKLASGLALFEGFVYAGDVGHPGMVRLIRDLDSLRREYQRASEIVVEANVDHFEPKGLTSLLDRWIRPLDERFRVAKLHLDYLGYKTPLS